jgi:hypothetical protein
MTTTLPSRIACSLQPWIGRDPFLTLRAAQPARGMLRGGLRSGPLNDFERPCGVRRCGLGLVVHGDVIQMHGSLAPVVSQSGDVRRP